MALIESNTAMAREIMGEGNGDGGELKEQRTRDIETEILRNFPLYIGSFIVNDGIFS